MNDFLPPPAPSAQAIESVFALLAAVSDPAAVKSRIADLVAQTQAVNDACAELAAERKRLTDENARAVDLREKENLLAGKESDLEKGALGQQVAAAALAERETKIAAAESELKGRQKAHTEKEAALTARVASMRSALA